MRKNFESANSLKSSFLAGIQKRFLPILIAVSMISAPVIARSVLLFAASMISAPAIASNVCSQARTANSVVRMPDTPYLPPYSGRIISSDVSASRQADGGISYTITLETAEHPTQIINWYKAAFLQYGWACETQGNNQYSLNALHGNNISTSINLMSPKRNSGAASHLKLCYRYFGTEQ